MKKRAVSAILVGAMLAGLLSGCGGNADSSAANQQGSSGSPAANQQESSESSVTDQQESSDSEVVEGYPTEIDMTEEPYTVGIQVVMLPGTDESGIEEREAAINEITLPAINCNVDIQQVWISEIANTTSMAVAGDEKIDIVHVGTVTPFSSMIGSDILLDMNEDNLIQNRGQALLEIFGDIIECGSVSGQQLAIPANVFNATGKGIVYNKTMADEYGITIGDEITFDDLDKALYEFHEKNPDVMAYFSGIAENNFLAWLQSYESFGTNSAYGIILDSEKNPVVENLYETDMFKDYCLRMQRWTEDGIQPGDPTDTNLSQDYFGAGQLFCVTANNNPEQWASWGAQSDFELGWANLVAPELTNAAITEYMWGIASNSKRPDKAMDFLNFLYSNADVANILLYGLEGENYEFAEGSDKVIIVNNTYNPLFYRGGNTKDMLIKSPAGEDYIDQLVAMEEEARISPTCNYMFNDAEFQTEASVINSTILEYLPRLQSGMAASAEDTIAMIDEFNQKLKASGIEDVIAANQEQLDAYLSAK